MLQTRIIVALGLTSEEVSVIKKNLPQKECQVAVADDVRDIIATHQFAVIVKADAIEKSDLDMLIDFYKETAPFAETVIIIGKIQISDTCVKYFTVCDDFDGLKEQLKYILLTAYRKQKKTENFSATLANAITILSIIRKHPYITSAELAKRLELSQRSIQRYIETLRVAGEWIEYSPTNKGWKLSEGKSVLWGDYL